MKNSMIKAVLSLREDLSSDMFSNLIKVLNALVNGEKVINLRSEQDALGEEWVWSPSNFYDYYTMASLPSSDVRVFFPSLYAVVGKEIQHLQHEDAELSAMKILHHWLEAASEEIKVSDLALEELAQALQELELKTQAGVVSTTKPKSVTYKGLADLGVLLNK